MPDKILTEDPTVDYVEIDKRILILQTISEANKALIEAGVAIKDDEPKEVVDKAAIKISARNKILACDGLKAALLGTISASPTLDAKALVALGLADGEEIVAEVARLRKAAIAMVS